MDSSNVIKILSALAQESRLAVFRLLVSKGPEGLPAGQIAECVGIPPNTLSFHLKELSHAGLVHSTQKGRFVYYTVNFAAMNELIGYLTENCCNGAPCAADVASACAPEEASDTKQQV